MHKILGLLQAVTDCMCQSSLAPDRLEYTGHSQAMMNWPLTGLNTLATHRPPKTLATQGALAYWPLTGHTTFRPFRAVGHWLFPGSR